MEALTLTHALEHARRSLGLAQVLLFDTGPADEVPSPSLEQAERRVKAEVAYVAGLLERASLDLAEVLEMAADQLDQDIAVLEEVMEAESRL